MQLNVFFVELLGDEKLNGVIIPVVIDNKSTLDDDTMAKIAKVLNNYRTVFVKKEDKNVLETQIYSVNGRVYDCLYANVATMYSLTDTSYIRELESGDKTLKVVNGKCKNNVNIHYSDRKALSIVHEISIPEIEVLSTKIEQDYTLEKIQDKNNPEVQANIIFAEGAKSFSRLRKDADIIGKSDLDNIIVYYDEEFSTVFFHLVRGKVFANAIDSRRQIGLILEYLLEKGIDKNDLNSICHVLKTGQYAVLKSEIDSGKVAITMDARTMVEGILNI